LNFTEPEVDQSIELSWREREDSLRSTMRLGLALQSFFVNRVLVSDIEAGVIAHESFRLNVRLTKDPNSNLTGFFDTSSIFFNIMYLIIVRSCELPLAKSCK
jgi:hypothetical protein